VGILKCAVMIHAEAGRRGVDGTVVRKKEARVLASAVILLLVSPL